MVATKRAHVFCDVPFSGVLPSGRLVQVVDEVGLADRVDGGLPAVRQPVAAAPAIRRRQPAAVKK
jgi:hypothetical protein